MNYRRRRFRKSRVISKHKHTPHSITSSSTTPFMGSSGRPTAAWFTPRTMSQWDHIHLNPKKNIPSSKGFSKHQIERRYRGKSITKSTNELFHNFMNSFLNNEKGNVPHLPIIVLSRQFVHTKLGFDNCIILDNARIVKNGTMSRRFIYDDKPFYIGRNILSLSSPIKLTQVNTKRIFLLCRFESFVANGIIPDPTINCFYLSDDNETKADSSQSDYVLIMSAGNEASKSLSDKFMVDDLYMNEVKKNMKINVRGDGKKHFKSCGKYYGTGIVAKYKIQDNLSFGVFATKKGTSMYYIYIFIVLYTYVSHISSSLSLQYTEY